MSPGADGPVVIGYDGSEGSKAAVDAVRRLHPGRRAVVVSVWESLAGAAAASAIAIPVAVTTGASKEIDEKSERQAAALAAEGAERLGGGEGVSAEAVLRPGTTWGAIVAVAEREDAAVVVVGSRGLSGVKSALLGSVSNGVLHHCDRPVLIVHGPPDAQAP